MGKISLLDCTLRDGAYIVDSKFGAAAIRGIIHKLQDANIEIIECGWLKDKAHTFGTSFYHLPEDLGAYISEKNPACTYVAMIDWDRYDDSVLPVNDGCFLDAVRVVFPRGKAREGLKIAKRIRDKGYRIYLQAANTLGYSQAELLDLAEQINDFEPESLSIVDTFGAMYEEDLLAIAQILDRALKKKIRLGFHSHNNQQMAFANAIAFWRFFKGSERDIVLDASLCGMGRGAGNATTELVAGYLNRKCRKNYNMDHILDAIDVYMTPFCAQYTWGYSTPYFIAGTYCCHVNNIAYLTDHHQTTAKDMRNIIASLSPEDRIKYDYDLLEKKYIENQSRLVDDEAEIASLRKAWGGKTIVLIAPGKSAADEEEKVNRYIAKHNVVTIAVNAILPVYVYDYMFVTNRVRYDYALEHHAGEFRRIAKVILSNVRTVPGENECVINFNRAIKRGWDHFDNAVMCCLRLLAQLGVEDVVIAGFDGFRHAYNESYADPSLPSVGGSVDYDELNDEIRDMYRDFKASAGKDMDIKFLTESYFTR